MLIHCGRMRSMPVTCKAVVIRKYVENGEHLVECQSWTENPKGEKTAPGKAIVMLPLRV